MPDEEAGAAATTPAADEATIGVATPATTLRDPRVRTTGAIMVFLMRMDALRWHIPRSERRATLTPL